MRKLGMFKIADGIANAEKYAALRALASKSGDQLSELDFYASEMRARRFWQDKPMGRGAGRFWFGLLYDIASDFGRSIWRPLAIWWVALSVAVTFNLISFSGTQNISLSQIPAAKCVDGPDVPVNEAIYLALAQGAVFGVGNPERVKISQRCLFGVENSATGLSSVPKMPVSVAIASVVHSMISGVCLFLLGLAIRNNFRA